MGTWTLSFDGDTRTLEAWGMTGGAIQEQSLTAGIFTAQVSGDALAALPWSYQDQVTVALDGVVQFVGVALPPQRRAMGDSETVTCRFADPWWWLGQGTYTQPWWVKATSAAYDAPRVVMFAAITPGVGWVTRTIAQDIADIITQVRAYFGPIMQLGTLSGDGFDAMPIPQRMLNVTYESAMRQALAWVPDAVQQWDHTTTPPTLHITQRGSATARSYAFADGAVMMSQQITRRDDLMVEGIEITYAGLDVLGNTTKVVDQAGTTTGTRIIKTVIDCTGSGNGAAAASPTVIPAVTRKYTVDSRTLDYRSADWWLENGDTGAQSAIDITVGDRSNVDFATNAPENAGHADLGGCDLQWCAGDIPKSRIFANTRMAVVTGYLTVYGYSEAEEGAPVLEQTKRDQRIVRLLVPVTKLNGEYEQVISEQSVSMPAGVVAVPSMITIGIAAALLAVWSVAQYEGGITITKAECDELVRLGDVVNVTGALDEWATMQAQVSGITRSIDTGTTELSFGVAAHLGLDEYVALIKMSRMRVTPAMDIDQQATGGVPVAAPDAQEEDDMVGPKAIEASVREFPQTHTVTTATAKRTMIFTDDDEEEE